jgi:hypothetical protein
VKLYVQFDSAEIEQGMVDNTKLGAPGALSAVATVVSFARMFETLSFEFC